ncbi:hypothetical protein Q8F57_026105 [Paraburkholderia terrae]|uniref:hypothetical protein n=1 Tax=Paraburkholderia terrae TaxID=311230 RepID=UPI00296AEAF6|nr:hypothetical protein [Paraburkholderia terrae]MDW3663250.1 hypothetical protein [Paraburkholderia terrae]
MVTLDLQIKVNAGQSTQVSARTQKPVRAREPESAWVDVFGLLDNVVKQLGQQAGRTHLTLGFGAVRALFFNQPELPTVVENQRLEQIGLAAVFEVSGHLKQTLYVGPNPRINSFGFASWHPKSHDFVMQSTLHNRLDYGNLLPDLRDLPSQGSIKRAISMDALMYGESKTNHTQFAPPEGRLHWSRKYRKFHATRGLLRTRSLSTGVIAGDKI